MMWILRDKQDNMILWKDKNKNYLEVKAEIFKKEWNKQVEIVRVREEEYVDNKRQTYQRNSI